MRAGQEAERRAVAVASGEITYWLTRKPVKNINLRIGRDGRVSASAPRRVSADAVDGFVRRKARFILHHLEQLEAGNAARPRPDPDRIPYLGRWLCVEAARGLPAAKVEGDRLRLCLPEPEDAAARRAAAERWFDRQSRELLAGMAERVGARFARWNAAPTAIRVRAMVSRWGSCSPRTGAITLNARLAALPADTAEYVIIHEFSHLLHPNHSVAFWDFVEQLVPDWRAHRAVLNLWQRELGM